ncbi:MAG: PilT/PilU family type 4a pilus ATPase [Burkholderiales bacterium]|nr:PilT/PilU family type 4a pilus ATPase [Burkholderiales bacterium]OJX02452.1 MAG: type IV pili twitching motility protein PilT [Burkholderiales bacterium 70-64]
MEREQASKFLHDLLKLMLAKNGSDLFLTAEFPPAFKVDGKVLPVSNAPLTGQHTVELARALMNDKQAAEFEAHKEVNFAISPGGIGRFRVNAFMQQNRVGIVLRTINTEIPTFEQLQLPSVLKDLALTKRGMIIMVGATGSGKSNTLAAVVGHRNEMSYGHIVTIEDPVEFVHPHRNCIVTHREVGVDTESWEVALKNTLRQAPDVIMIGEIRDRETMEHAVAFAETGHLCLATLHSNSANQALDRIINFFPEERRAQLLMDLSLNLKAIVSQRLIPIATGKGRVPAVEILLNSPLIADLIFKGEVGAIKEVMKKSRELGMQTFDQALFDLFEAGRITYEDALRNADSVNDLRLNIKLNSKRSERDLSRGIEHLDIV